MLTKKSYIKDFFGSKKIIIKSHHMPKKILQDPIKKM